MRALAAGLAVLVLLSATATAAAADDMTPAREADAARPALIELLRQGVEANARGDLDGADAVWARVRRSYPGHPAAPVFEWKTLDLRKSLDWTDASYNPGMRERSEEAVARSEEWLARSPDSAWALFYLGQARFQLMMLDGIEGSYLSAGRNGERAREALERALELDPELVDAKLPLGAYYYYAAVATRYIRWLTWLWFVPTGELETGLAYVDEVWRRGDLNRFEAGVTLVNIWEYMEERPDLAAPILAALHEAHPENSWLQFEIVELRMALGDYTGTVEAALALEESAGDQYGDARRRNMARIWRARAELNVGRVEQADAILEPLEEQQSMLSGWSRRWVLLTRANLLDVTGQRDQAVWRYKRVIDEGSRYKSSRTVRMATEGLDAPYELEEASLLTDSAVSRLQ